MGFLTKMRTSYAQKRSSMTPYPDAGHTSKSSNADSTLLFGESGSSCTSADSANPPIDPSVVQKFAPAPTFQKFGNATDLHNAPQNSSDRAHHPRAAVKLMPRPSSYMPSLSNELMSEPAADFSAVNHSGKCVLPLPAPRRRPVSDATLGQRPPVRRPPTDSELVEKFTSGTTQPDNDRDSVYRTEMPLSMQRKPPSDPSFNAQKSPTKDALASDVYPQLYPQVNNNTPIVSSGPEETRSTTPAADCAPGISDYSAELSSDVPPAPLAQSRTASVGQRAPFAAGVNGSIDTKIDASNVYAEEWLQFRSFLSQYLAQPQNRRVLLEKTRTGVSSCLPYMDQLLQMQDQNPHFAQAMLQHVSHGPQNERFSKNLRSSSSSSFGHSRALSECFQSTVSHFPPVRGQNKSSLPSPSRAGGSPVQYPVMSHTRRISLSPLVLNSTAGDCARRASNTSDSRSISYGSVGSKVGLSVRDFSNKGSRIPSKLYRDFSNDLVSVDKKASIMSRDRISDYNALFFDEDADSSLNGNLEEELTMLADGTLVANELSHAGDSIALVLFTDEVAVPDGTGSENTRGEMDAPLLALGRVRTTTSGHSGSSVASGETESSIQHSAKFRGASDADGEDIEQPGFDTRSPNGAIAIDVKTSLSPGVPPAESKTIATAFSTEKSYNDNGQLVTNVGCAAQIQPSYYEYPVDNFSKIGLSSPNQWDGQDHSQQSHTSSLRITPASVPVTRRSSQLAMNFETPDQGFDAQSDFSARLSALTMNHREPQHNPEHLADFSARPSPSPPHGIPRWNQSPRPYAAPPPFLLRPMSRNGFSNQSEHGEQYGSYYHGQPYGHDLIPYQQGQFHPPSGPQQFRPMSPDQFNAMKRMLYMSIQGQSPSPSHSPSAANFGFHTGNPKLDSKISKLIELRQVIASGNKSVEYRLKWVRTIIDATNCGVYEHVTIKGEPLSPGQELRSQAMFVKSCITQLSKLLNECEHGKHTEISGDVYYLHGCLAIHAYRGTYCQDYGIEKDLGAAKAYFDRCLEVEPDNSRALYRLGELHELMNQDDIMPALSCYKRSAKAGYNRAIFKIGMLYLNDSRVRSARVIRYLTNLSSIDPDDINLNDEDREDLEDVIGLASFQLGHIYEGIYPPGLTMEDEFIQECLKLAPVNYTKSLAYYNKSAKLECLLAQVKLGSIYERGELDRPLNPSKSVQWYLKASSSPLSFERHPEAMMGMVRWCLSGTNLASKIIPQPNHESAVYWCERAIEQFNLPEAFFCMGEFASSGIINSDPDVWYNQARELGYERSV